MIVSRAGVPHPRRREVWRARALILPPVLALACALARPAGAAMPGAEVEQGLLCRDAVRQAEAGSLLPPHLLAGIARVESGRADPVTGRVHPWPWMINSQGQDHVFASKAEAVAYARGLQARGLTSFDVGCLQVNLMYHPDAFSSLEEAFDPLANARYAVKFLTELHARAGDWETASAWYHSASPAEGRPYQGKVASAMAEEAASGDVAPRAGATPPAARLAGMAPAGMPMAAFAARGLPGRPGMLVAGTGPGMLVAGTGPGMAAPGMAAPAGLFGRDLTAYRMRPVAVPVAVMGSRLLAAR